ncbi:hypothetical protein ACWDBO_31250 [Streptomyces mirabilis]|uniref:hypothetical protein n=1 Tax=Streptomyces mirabilis TaxID=68239 RepID=UPI00331CE469
MTFTFTDQLGDVIDALPVQLASGPAVSIAVNEAAVWVPVDRVEEFIAGVRDAARQASAASRKPAPEPVRAYGPGDQTEISTCGWTA